MRRRSDQSVLKVQCLTLECVLILSDLSIMEEAGIGGVAVKCIDIVEKVNSEGRFLCDN